MEKLEQWNGHGIRFVEHDGEWWAVLADIAKALELEQRFIKRRLEDDVFSKHPITDSLGRQQEMLIVNEFGIYETISNKYGYPKMVKKSEMTEPMLRDREQVLDETVELMLVKERYGLNFSVANTIYGKTC